MEIPINQAAYRKNRSTTEHAFATKLIIERAITSKNETVYLLLLDMTKAFDSIKRSILINELQKVINNDELHLIKMLLDVKIAVKCGNKIGDFFNTDTGVPQGDCSSANEFTFYLAKSLIKKLEQIATELQDHTYITKTIESTIPAQFNEHNLQRSFRKI